MPNISSSLADLAIVRSLVVTRVANGLAETTAQAYNEIIDDITYAVRTAESPIVLKTLNSTISELQGMVTSNENILMDDLNALAISEAKYTVSSTNAVVGADILKTLPTEKALNRIYSTSLMVMGENAVATIPQWFKSVDESMLADIEKSVKMGIVNGETNNQIATRLKNKLGMNATESMKIARTATSQVMNEARMTVYEENEDIIKGYERLETIDSTTCKQCAYMDGKFYKVGQPKPPATLHANCRGLYNVVLKSWEDMGIDLTELPEGTRASASGVVSGDEKFKDYFKHQDDKWKENWLGKGRWYLYEKGAIRFSDLVTNKGRILTLEELNEKYN